MASLPRPANLGRLVALAVVGLLVIAGAVTFLRPGADTKMLTASFPRTVSIYEGSDVQGARRPGRHGRRPWSPPARPSRSR